MAIWYCFIRLLDWVFAVAKSGHRRSTIRSIFGVAKFNDGYTDQTDTEIIQTIDDKSVQIFPEIFGAGAGTTTEKSNRFIEILGRQPMVGKKCGKRYDWYVVHCE